jgi:hypothetical protein
VLVGTAVLVVWTLAVLSSTARALSRRNWKRATALPCVLPVALALVFIGARAGDYIHLAIMLPYYSYEIRLQPYWQSKPIRFYWGDRAAWALDGIQLTWLVYDASGKTVRGSDQPHFGDGYGELGLDTRHLIGNYFLSTYHSP